MVELHQNRGPGERRAGARGADSLSGMANAAKRWWNYLGAKANTELDDRADPRVQLEQAMAEAQDQHRRLKEQAANVIANQRQAEIRLNRSMEEYERLTANARQALDHGRPVRSGRRRHPRAEYTTTAEAFANRLVAVEQEVEDTKTLVLQSAQAAEQAKAAVAQNAALLQKKLVERQKLLSQLDQAKMQEQMNRSVASLSATVGEDVPTFAEVPREDRDPLRPGQGHVGAHRRAGPRPHARGGAGHHERRGRRPPRHPARAARTPAAPASRTLTASSPSSRPLSSESPP